jgi:mannose-1-phosphate guanylyltransferase
VESDFDWDDVGEWPAVARHYESDDAGNVIKGDAVVVLGANNIVMGAPGHLTALIGLDDVIVVQTKDATLVCPKEKAQEIKGLVQRISEHPDWKHLA